jgi:hypothetical protein
VGGALSTDVAARRSVAMARQLYIGALTPDELASGPDVTVDAARHNASHYCHENFLISRCEALRSGVPVPPASTGGGRNLQGTKGLSGACCGRQ